MHRRLGGTALRIAVAAVFAVPPAAGAAMRPAVPEPLFAEAVYLEGSLVPSDPAPEQDSRRMEWARSYRCCGGGTSTLDAWLHREGPTPASHPVVQSLGTGSVRLVDTYQPRALVQATLTAAAGELLPGTSGVPLVRYESVRVTAAADCRTGVHGVATTFGGLTVNGVTLPASLPPNTAIPLGAWTLVVNEQRTSAGSTGIRVAALHLVAGPEVSEAIRGDVVIGQVAVAASCTRPVGATAPANPVSVRHERGTARAGQVSWHVAVANSGTAPCVVERVVLHGPAEADLTGVTGTFGSVSEPSGHGSPTDRELKSRVVIAPGTVARATVTYRLRRSGVYRRPDAAVDHAATVHCAGSGLAFGGYGAAVRPAF